MEEHIGSPDTTLDGTEWGLIQKWFIVTAQKDGATPTSKSWIAFASSALLSNEELIHRWISDRMDSTLGRRPEPSSGVGGSGVQGNNIAAMGNLSSVIATEVGRGLGVAMQQATQAATNTGTGRSGSSSKDVKPYTQDQLATLLGFHGAMNVTHLKKVWRLFKSTKVPNYDYMRRAIKGEMLKWADENRSWIEEGVYFDNVTLDSWIALKFNPGDSTALYSSADKGISILKCRTTTSAHLEEMRRNEDMWETTKGNATFIEVVKAAKNKEVSAPAFDHGELRSNAATFCALLFTLFGGGCDLYRAMFDILNIISHPFSGQDKLAYTPEGCRQITWAIIVDTRSYFDDIKLADDFLHSTGWIQFPVSTLDGDYMSIKHGIKIERHNFPMEWQATAPGRPGAYQQGNRAVGGGYQQGPPGVPPPGLWGQALAQGQSPPTGPAVPFNWKPANFVDSRHPKIQALLDPLLSKLRGKICNSLQIKPLQRIGLPTRGSTNCPTRLVPRRNTGGRCARPG